ncbi:ABC transporter substrate-binding protein [Tichowtungia aerotolerans]|uniref:Extracellular solute-binding protein n=1 Tax=Tichowtungia aerotolerans TaxID=2697043 RepID=A0A6P1M6B1_9BACT|nr:ABC transporter substrate-binding protein [Tichowtungia aerotolerans]QHI68543.1 extracellular solute-binding protein [Tichowtungia aerotolerans]
MRIKQILLVFVAAGLAISFLRYTDPRPRPARDGQIVLRFWNGFTGPDGRQIIKLVRQFNEEHEDIKVLLQRIEWGTYYNKLYVAGLGGRAPDVFVVHAPLLPRFAAAGLAAPLDSWVSGDGGFPVADFDPVVWNAGQVHGTQRAVPLDVHPFGMYLNRSLFRKAGLVDDAGDIRIPQTREPLLAAMRAMTRDLDADGAPDEWGYVLTTMRMIFQSVMTQYGGSLVSPDGKTSLINSPENRAVMQFFVDLIEKEKVCPQPEGFDSWVGFRQGKVGIVFEGSWMLSELEKSDLEWCGAPFPQIGPQPGVWASSHMMCISDSADSLRQRAARTFIRYLSDHSLEWAATGQIPVRRSLRETAAFKALPVQSAFAELIDSVRFSPAVPYKLELDSELELAFEKVLRRTATPEEALAVAHANIEKIIARMKPSAEEVQ